MRYRGDSGLRRVRRRTEISLRVSLGFQTEGEAKVSRPGFSVSLFDNSEINTLRFDPRVYLLFELDLWINASVY